MRSRAASKTDFVKKFWVIAVVDLGPIDYPALRQIGGHGPVFPAVAGIPVAIAAAAELLIDALAPHRAKERDIVGLVLSRADHVFVRRVRHRLGELEGQPAQVRRGLAHRVPSRSIA